MEKLVQPEQFLLSIRKNSNSSDLIRNSKHWRRWPLHAQSFPKNSDYGWEAYSFHWWEQFKAIPHPEQACKFTEFHFQSQTQWFARIPPYLFIPAPRFFSLSTKGIVRMNWIDILFTSSTTVLHSLHPFHKFHWLIHCCSVNLSMTVTIKFGLLFGSL